MRKEEELSDPESCLNKARPGELVFVLLGRDPAAPAAIREWCETRVLLGKNTWYDPQIVSAMQTAQQMELERLAVGVDPAAGTGQERDGGLDPLKVV